MPSYDGPHVYLTNHKHCHISAFQKIFLPPNVTVYSHLHLLKNNINPEQT
jgi:hypothetical protein